MSEMTTSTVSALSAPPENHRRRLNPEIPVHPFLALPKSAVGRYAVSILAVVAALLLRKLLNPLLGPQNAYHAAWAAVVFSSWYCGFGPAILSMLMASIGTAYFFVPPFHSFPIQDNQDVWGLVGFLFFSSLIVLMGEANRRSIASRDAAEQEAMEMRNLLEERIRERTRELESKTEEVARQAKLLDSANDAIFVRTKNHSISYWNRGATRLYGWQEHEALGKTPHDILKTEFPVPVSDVLYSENDSWEGELRQRKRDGSEVIVASRWTTLRDADGNISGWLEINTDITLRKRAEDAARSLGGRMLQLQDAERRKFARELHDGVGQYLASIKMFLDGAMHPNVPPEQQRELLAESTSILEKCLAETRTVSHLLHPPLLDEAGLASAVQWYAEGFSQRSGIQLDLDLQPDLGRLPSEVEITLFRVLQEGLTNIHRHSRASEATLSIVREDGSVRLEITDSGCGIPQDRLKEWRKMRAPLGVGMAGMLERTREMGGTFDVQSSSSGTKLTVVIPVSEAEVAALGSDAPLERDSTHGVSAG
jgi:PAS domain S-box-containing protein